ncbi:MAG TPA: hypothetical protein VGO47_02220 [Chlamydiales bacterium]|nr:hypothetical protein [Chlamydiales bacterium]
MSFSAPVVVSCLHQESPDAATFCREKVFDNNTVILCFLQVIFGSQLFNILAGPGLWNATIYVTPSQHGNFSKQLITANLATLPVPVLTQCCSMLRIPFKPYHARRLLASSICTHFLVECNNLHISDPSSFSDDPTCDRSYDLFIKFQQLYRTKVLETIICRSLVTPLDARRQKFQSIQRDDALDRASKRTDWPHIVPKDVIINACHNYNRATTLSIPPTCAVCSRQRFVTSFITVTTSDCTHFPSIFTFFGLLILLLCTFVLNN